MRTIDEYPEPVDLNVNPETVCAIIRKAREFDLKVNPVGTESGSNPTDDQERSVLEDNGDGADTEELRGMIDRLDEDEIIDLIALAWTGRGNFTRDEWGDARALADERHRRQSADYLVGIPLLGNCLEDGLEELGYSCTDYEAGNG